ncbi:MAG: WXG100 family type VII secretion target [Sporichthyaceae bacterium]
MSGEISKQDQALTRGAQMVAEAKQDLDAQLKALGGKLANIGGQWTGVGATSFNSAMQKWNEQARTIINALDTFEASLKSAENTYTNVDSEQQAAFAKLSGRLG